jgi:hypothetical protein
MCFCMCSVECGFICTQSNVLNLMCFIHAQSEVLLYVLNWILLKWMCFVKCTPMNLSVDSPKLPQLSKNRSFSPSVSAVHHNTRLIANLVSEFSVGLPVNHFFTYLWPSEEIHQVLLCILHLFLQLSFGSNVLFWLLWLLMCPNLWCWQTFALRNCASKGCIALQLVISSLKQWTYIFSCSWNLTSANFNGLFGSPLIGVRQKRSSGWRWRP